MITATVIVTTLLAFTNTSCPMHAQHMAAANAVDHRHDTFAFSHGSSKHTLRRRDAGEAIELRATDGDVKTSAAIRSQLKEIAEAFRIGDFSTPKFVHEKMPDGVDTMLARQSSIQYRFEELPEGARVLITTSDKQALDAVHRFLRFQIEDHRTGDPTAVH
jgi:hypothetical protein